MVLLLGAEHRSLQSVPYIDFRGRLLERPSVLSSHNATGPPLRLQSKQPTHNGSFLVEWARAVGTHLPRRQGIRVYERGRRCQRFHPTLAPNPSKLHGIFAQVRVMPQVLPFRLREVQVPSPPLKPLWRNPEGF
jgi:hypothetical protein